MALTFWDGISENTMVSFLLNHLRNRSKKLLKISVTQSREGKAWKQEDLIDALNPVITGWANYHQSVVSREIFHKIDNRIWNMLWHWAKRRHPNKPKHWIANKYWHSDGNRNWVFSEGDKLLNFLSDTRVIKHTRLKLDMNPYLDRDYFVLRKVKQGVKKLKGITKNVWDEAKKICKPETETMTNNCCPI